VAEKTVDRVSSGIHNLVSLNTGYLMIIASIELNTNASSLFIDKTKEKVAAYNVSSAKTIEPGRFFYVLPPRITQANGIYDFDTDMLRLIRNYMTLGKYGVPVDDIKQAEYIVVVNIKESFEKRYGTNSSSVAFSIMDKLDLPVFAASVRIESASDKNFWYHAQKDARPVKELTMKGLSYIMTKSLPEAHGDKETLAKEASKYTDRAKAAFN
jgi:hypothetical protein